MIKFTTRGTRVRAIAILVTLTLFALLLTSLVVTVPVHALRSSISIGQTASANYGPPRSAANQNKDPQLINKLYSYFFNAGRATRASEVKFSTSMAPAVLDQLSRTSAPVGDPPFTLTLTGSNFVTGAVVNFGSTSLNTTFVNDTSLTADVTASELSTPGLFDVTVVNPGEAASAPITFAVVTVATLTNLSQTSALRGGSGFTLTVTGSNFFPGAVVNFGATSLSTTYVSSTSLTANVTATELATAGTFSVTVVNTGVAASNSISFTVNNPVPTATVLSPDNKLAGTAGFTLSITGTNFVNGATVSFGGTVHTVDVGFVDSAHLTATIAASEIATAGTRSVTVTNPTPGGGTTSALTFTVNNPVPTTTNISPTSATTGDAAFTLTVNGTNFVSGSTINFAGTNHPATTFVNSTQLTTQIAASEVATGGTKTVTVTNAAPGGGTSTPALTFTVNNPVPTTTSLSPTSATAGDAAFTLTVNGANFVSGVTINFNGTNHPVTTFVNSTQVTTQIAASEVAVAGSVPVTVTNPTPAGGTSTPALTFTINNPVPTVTTLSPNTKFAGDPAFTLTVNGTNFNASSVVQFSGSARTTTFVNSTQLTAQIPATDLTGVGLFPITVVNPAPGGGTSNSSSFTVSSVPVPTITAPLIPASVTAGGVAFTLTVNGTNFVTGSVVRFNGSARTTTFVSGTQLTASIPATDLANAGLFPITVLNPAPGGGVSNAVNLTINPSITTISPPTVRAGDIAFTLTVNGTGFVVGTTVRFNAANRSTTFVNSTRLTASILATDIAVVGTYPITVQTPAPSSLISNSVNITAIPSLGNLSPMTAVVGNPAFTLTVTGSGFVNGSTVRWNGSNRTTTFVNTTKLTASISAADIASVGARQVSVLNPAPTNLASNSINFNVTNPPPATECAAGPDVVISNPGLINSGPARSQMFRTDDNIWWGAFSNNVDGIYFFHQSAPGTWVQGPLIDANFVAGLFVAGAPDTLWTGTNLFVLIQESITLAKLYKYTYTPATQTFTVVSGFPVNLPLIGVGTTGSGKAYGTLAIEQDSTGKLWAAYTGSGLGGDGNVRVITSTSADQRTWDTTGIILDSGISTLKTEGSTIVRFGNKIGVGWSNLIASEDGFRFHNDGDPATTWSTKEVIDSGLGPEGTGGVSAKQMTMKAHPDGRIFLVADDNDGLNNHLHLYIRTTGGVWGNKTLVVNDFTAMPSKPVLLLDTENSTVNVIYKDGALTTNGLSGQTFITQSSMTSPAFNPPCLFIDTSDDSVLSTSNPTSTKQPVNATTDLMVAVSTGKTGNRILTNSVDLTPNALTVFAISPKEATAGEATFTLTVTGKLFVSTSVVRFAGVNRTTTFVNSGKVTASIPNSAIATAGTFQVVVRNPGPVDSNSKDFLVTATNPVPVVNLIAPVRELVGSPQFTMTLNGTGFRRSSIVRFNGVNKTTQYVSDTQLTATIPASDLLVPGPFPITVFNPTPGGGTSTINKRSTFFVEPPCSAPTPISFSGITLFNTNKSQMWYNDGFWWGAFSDNLSGVFFYKQNGTNPFTKGSLIDGNFNGRPDVMWNGTNLFVLVYEFNTQAKFYKYTYNPATDVYTVVSGFPVTLPLIGIGTGTTSAQTGSVTIAQDSTGKIWGTYPGTGPNGDGNYRVIWTTSADHKIWDTNGFILETGGALNTQEVTNIVHFGGNKIGVAWSHQLNPIEDGFRYHVDGDPETVWSAKETIDAGLGNEVGIGGVADNHGSMRASPDGRIFLVAKDSDDVGYLHLYIRSAAGVWGQPILVDIDPHAQTTRPALALDLENSEVYVLYADASTSLMYLGHTSMDTPNFGPPCPFITQAAVSDATLTKQNLRASMGFMGGGSSGGALSAIYLNPVTLATGSGNSPVLTSVSPTVAGLGGPSFNLTVNGSNFANNAIVYLNGIDRPTTFVSPTQLTARIFATDIAALGTLPATVMNPKGGSSAAVNLTVGGAISGLVPDNTLAGSPAFTLTVNGAGFVSGTVVNFNGLAQTTTFVNANQVTAQIPAASVLTAGTYPVTITNPGNPASPPVTFTVNNPAPTLTNLSPLSAIVGTGAFTLTATGTNFNNSSVVSFNGVARTTTFVSSTQVTAAILATDVAAPGAFPVVVTNPAPGGGAAAALTFNVANPAPTTTTISPTNALVGSPAFTLIVNGTGFVNGAVVRLNGTDRVTTFVNSTQLTAQVLATDLQTAGTIAVTAFNPLPGGGTSNVTNLSVDNPIPIMTNIAPTTKTAGDLAFVLTVNGSNFNNGSIVRFDGTNRTTSFVSATQLTAQITLADLQAAGAHLITVFNPAPGGGTSAAATLTVNNPVPTLTTINPTSKVAGDPAFVLTVNGTNFNSSSVVQFNGAARTTTFVSATQLTAQITAADVQAPGNYSITVFNSVPGGGTSTAGTLQVSSPGPTLTGILPPTKNAGDAAFDLTVIGTGFTTGSEVRINGNARTTIFVSSTQLTGQITAADVAAGGTFAITVFNPPPGGGISNLINLTVNNLLPTLTSILPTTKTAGDPAFALTVNGTNFNSTSSVRFNGVDRTTTFVSTTQLTAQITAADVVSGGTPAITVFNPAPAGGTSNATSLTINNPAPTLTNILPAAKLVGDPAFTLTVNGTNFNASSIVRLGGANRTTTFVNATQLTAQITLADLAAAGTFQITVFNPTPGGGASTPADLTVSNRVPTITTILPTTKTAGDAAFTLTVNGTNFVNGSVVRLGGIDRTTSFVSATQLTAQITAADVATAGTIQFTVFNAAPGGGTSNTSDLTVNNPAPAITNINPTSKVAGNPAFVLTVNGTNFISSSVVQFNGAARTTTFVSATQLTAQISAADIQAPANYSITVFNPAPGGGTSTASTLAVTSGGPVLTSISPPTKNAGDAAFDLTITGTGFDNSSVVRFNGNARTTIFVSSTQLTGQITAADVAAGGTFAITVFNPPPGGGISNLINLTVNNLLPTLTSILPTTKTAGDPAFVLTVNGTNFNSTSSVRFNGVDRTTTFVSATQLTAQITAADVVSGGTPAITVFNPAPAGGTSNATSLTINNPAPTLTNILPAAKLVGDPAFTLTVNGTNFNASSIVRLGGANRTTTFVNATQLTAQITLADLATAGTFQITVFNPTPGGGASTPADLTVSNRVPTITTILPTTKTAGDAAFTLTVNGTNFVNGSVVRLGGIDRTTSFVSATQLTAQITAADVATAGTIQFTVFNAAPGGGTSNTSDLTVNNPAPAITNINPTNQPLGGPAFDLTVNGTGFVAASVVRFNGSNRPTTFVSTTQLTAQIPATDLNTQGNFPITVVNAAPGGGTSNSVNLSVAPTINPTPTISSINPTSAQAGGSAFSLTVNGTGFVAPSVVQWNGQARVTTLISATQLSAQITASDVAVAGQVPVTVLNPAPGGGTSNSTNFTLTVNPRTTSLGSSSGSANSTVTMPVQITALGNEAAFGFSLNFDPALLSNPQVTLGSDVVGATLNSNANQANLGRFGVALSLPSGQSLAAGTRQIANVTFTTASVATQTTTPVTFGDQPIVREVSSALAQVLPSAYTPGSVTITLGFEADVAPRPNGTNNGTVAISDWVQAGRFTAGLDAPSSGGEFQRADSAPMSTMGNGSITISDWVQAGRYASGLDPVLAAGGPTGPPTGPTTAPFAASTAQSSVKKLGAIAEDVTKFSTLRLVDTKLSIANDPSYSIEIDAQGNENALSFSFMFDPAKFAFVSAQKSDELNSATLNVNELEAEEGRVGIAMALPTSRTFGPGKHQVVTLTFKAKMARAESILLTFSDKPLVRELVDVNANTMKAEFLDLTTGINPIEDGQFFVAQQYLDILNRTSDAEGLEYWTNQIRECAGDARCIGQRRLAVSTALFGSEEFKRTGYTIYRLYKAAYGHAPSFDQFMADRALLVDGPQLPAGTLEFAKAFVQRSEFLQIYPGSLSSSDFVAKLYNQAGLRDMPARNKAAAALNDGLQDRAQVLLDLISDKSFEAREYDAAVVLMQYFVFLRHEPEKRDYDQWMNSIVVGEPTKYLPMVCSFINSREYQKRFSTIVPRTIQTCGP